MAPHEANACASGEPSRSEAFATLRGALILCWRGRGDAPVSYIGTDPLPDTLSTNRKPGGRPHRTEGRFVAEGCPGEMRFQV